MLKEKKELINYLRSKCNGLVFKIDYSLFEGNSIEKPIFYISVLKE